MKLTFAQNRLLSLVKEGVNIDVSGKGGVGKSFMIKQIESELKSLKKNYVLLAPTGVTAVNIGGQTIHSYFSIFPKGVLNEKDCNYVKKEKRRLWDKVDTIIIDEKSMIRADLFEAINWTLQKNGVSKKFQWIILGDLGQLEPVITNDEIEVFNKIYDSPYYYSSQFFRMLSFEKVELKKIHRQSDKEFINALDEIRNNKKTNFFGQFINKDIKTDIIICPTNDQVRNYNTIELNKLKGKLMTYKATTAGNFKQSDFIVDEFLTIKDGCKVMYLINSRTGHNGMIGTLVVKKDSLFFKKANGTEFELFGYKWESIEYALNKDLELIIQTKGSIVQYPIKVAYAATVHKVQGLQFDSITYDCRNSHNLSSKGHYVALSRCKNINGLKLIK
jgi:ATP-dependent exoDNAse (exonuclease V) alpha subunit